MEQKFSLQVRWRKGSMVAEGVVGNGEWKVVGVVEGDIGKV